MSSIPGAAKIPHNGGVSGGPSSCADAVSDLLSWDQPADDKGQRRLQDIIPGLIVNATAAWLVGKKGKGCLHGTTTLVNNKALCSPEGYEGQNPSEATDKREQKVHTDYMSAAKGLGKKFRGAQGGQAANTAKLGKFTSLCSERSETHLRESAICAALLRTHSHTSTCSSTTAPLVKLGTPRILVHPGR